MWSSEKPASGDRENGLLWIKRERNDYWHKESKKVMYIMAEISPRIQLATRYECKKNISCAKEPFTP